MPSKRKEVSEDPYPCQSSVTKRYCHLGLEPLERWNGREVTEPKGRAERVRKARDFTSAAARAKCKQCSGPAPQRRANLPLDIGMVQEPATKPRTIFQPVNLTISSVLAPSGRRIMAITASCLVPSRVLGAPVGVASPVVLAAGRASSGTSALGETVQMIDQAPAPPATTNFEPGAFAGRKTAKIDRREAEALGHALNECGRLSVVPGDEDDAAATILYGSFVEAHGDD